MDIQAIFDVVLENARKVEGFNPSGREVEVIRLAFGGLFKIRGKGFRANPVTWCGFVRNDRTIDEKKMQQCLQSAFGRMFHYHMGWESSYLGTIINATQGLESLAGYMGVCEIQPSYFTIHKMQDGPEKTALENKYEEIKQIQKKFADHCDTFCQVFVYLLKQGKTSSVAGDVWRKALLGE